MAKHGESAASGHRDNREWLYGLHSVTALLKTEPERVSELRFQRGRKDQRLAKIRALAEKLELPFAIVSREDLDNLAPGNHQGVAALCALGEVKDEHFLMALLDNLDRPPLLLILDGVTDPHNLGACLRTADGAGVDAVVAPKDRSAGVTAVVRKVASGAAETIPFVAVTNLARTLKQIQERGVWVVGTAGDGACDLYSADLRGPLALVMGAEGEGMRRLTREHCDLLVSLPMAGSVSSLNVAVATGVSLYEIVRQRRAAGSS